MPLSFIWIDLGYHVIYNAQYFNIFSNLKQDVPEVTEFAMGEQVVRTSGDF